MQGKLFILPAREPTQPGRSLTHNLPAQLTPLIGREQEIATICTLLRRPEVRLITLIGTGGVGKTRLALQAARELVYDFADGVYFVSLAPISDPDLVMSTIAQTLELEETGDQPLLDLLKTSLRDKQLLLLLDNFEQVISAAMQVTDLLSACPQLKVVVTSREVLHVRGEQEFAVPPLAFPDLKHLPDLVALSQYEAVALFISRAQAVKPAFAVTNANAPAVAEICVRLDGLPLAIELAAARSKLLPPQALLARLGRRLAVLTGGARDAPARQQTLRNTLEWSYHLLEPEEQRLFRRLTVFVGGWTLEAVEAVCYYDSENEQKFALEEVASLLDKSLVQQQHTQRDEEPRLVMLETVREYALECLALSGELEFTRWAHANYYLRVSEEVDLQLVGSQQAVWLECLEREHDNLRAAMRWSLERVEAGQEPEEGREMALRFGAALRRFWNIRGHWSEGRAFLERALEASEGTMTAVRAKALVATASMTIYVGDHNRGEALCRESLAGCRESGDTAGIAFSLYLLGILAWQRGELAVVHSMMEESLELYEELNDKVSIAHILSALADLARLQGEYARAQARYEESLAIDRELGNARGIAMSLSGVAQTLFVSQGDSAVVRSLLEECLALYRELGDKDGIAYCLSLLGLVALQQDDVTTARLQAEESVVRSRERGDPWSTTWSLYVLARVEAHQGDYATARVLYEEGLAIAKKSGDKLHIALILEGMASVLATQGEPVRAARLWGAAEVLRETIGAPIWPVDRATYKRTLATACALLGKKVFAAAWAEGRTITLEQALATREPVTTLISTLAEPSSTPPARPVTTYPDGLTAREVEVLRLVAQGFTDAQVAEQLVISPRTVNWHLTTIYSKIGVSSRSAATRYAIEQKLV